MIDQKELRIGNFVHYDDRLLVVFAGDFHRDSTDFMEAIPITEEWLLKFGFTLVPVPSAYGYDCNRKFNGGNFRGAFSKVPHIKGFYYLGFLIYGTHKKIEYVHQLQNLFYCLTGEELTIKK